MPEPPRTGDAVVELVRKSELADDDVLNTFLQRSGPLPPSAADTASAMVEAGILTRFQAGAILQGKHRGFRLGHYKILDKIGTGGMGQVFLAEHVRMKRLVALKVLPGRKALDRTNVERFYREARAVAALDHPNIVRAHDVACDKNTYYLVLEYIEGESLEQKRAAAGGRLPMNEACACVVQAAAGLQHAHEKGLAHRDIKPGNLLVDGEGVVKILDMGLARFFENEEDKLTHRMDPGGVMGTADYVSPEQLIDSSRADHRADIYSLGATLYHLVTGQPPFSGTTTAKLVAHQLQSVPPAHAIRKGLPEALSAVIARMMAKDPDDRYQSAAEVVEALMPFVDDSHDGSGMSARLPPIAAAAVAQSTANLGGSAGRARAVARQKRQLLIGVAAAVAVLVVAVAVAALRDKDPQNPRGGGGSDVAPQPDVLRKLYALDVGKTNVEAALFTPGDAQLITSGSDKLVRVWDAKTGEPVRSMEGHAGNVRALSLLPGGKRLLSASHDRTLKLWEVATGKCLKTYEGHAAQVVGVAALPDGRRFLSSAADGTIWLWDVETREVLNRYPRAPLPVYGLVVTSDGRRAVAGMWDAKRNSAKSGEAAKLTPVAVWVFEVESGKELMRRRTESSVSHVRMSPDDRLAVFGTAEGVMVWDIDADGFRAFTGVSRRVTCATFTRDGRHVLATGYANSLHIWDAVSGTLVAGESGLPAQGYLVSTSHDGTTIAVVGAEGGAVVWKLPSSLVPAR
jgi:eukaryotic-like serine/threonine-protein kinase